MPGKRVVFDPEIWLALDSLAKDRMQNFQELADEAFRDILRKYNRPSDLRSALRQSAEQSATIHQLSAVRRKRKSPSRQKG